MENMNIVRTFTGSIQNIQSEMPQTEIRVFTLIRNQTGSKVKINTAGAWHSSPKFHSHQAALRGEWERREKSALTSLSGPFSFPFHPRHAPQQQAGPAKPHRVGDKDLSACSL